MRRIMKDRVEIISGAWTGLRGYIIDDPLWDANYMNVVTIKADNGVDIKIQARYVRRLRNEKG